MIDGFEAWLKSEKHKAIDAQTGELLIARDGIWVDAFETFMREQRKDYKNVEECRKIKIEYW